MWFDLIRLDDRKLLIQVDLTRLQNKPNNLPRLCVASKCGLIFF